MAEKVKILILENNPYDIELLHYELKKDGLQYEPEVVLTKADYKKALSNFCPDLILSDYSLPTFDGLSAFKIKEVVAPEVPFIIISGTIGEENAVELIKMGVTDYVQKDKIHHLLIPKIKRALKEASERKEKITAELQLSQREEQLRKIMDLSVDVICTLDEEGCFITVGAASRIVWSYTPDELIGRKVVELVHNDDKEKTLKALEDLKNGIDLTNFENRFIRKNGEPVTLLWSGRWDLKEKSGYCIARDATDIKKAEEKIKINEKRFRTILQNSVDGFTLLAADGTVIERSLSALKILGLTEKDASGKLSTDLVPPDDLPIFKEAYARVKDNPKDIVTIQHRLLVPEGGYKWLETTFNNQLAEPAVGAIILNFRDITERKNSEIELKKSEARLKEAQAIGHIGSWEVNWADGSVVWSDEMYRMFGVEKNHFKPSIESYMSFVHPDDRLAVIERFEKAKASSKNDSMTYRIVRLDGEVRYVFSEGRFELDDNATPIGFVGIQQDITERMLTEIALQKSEEKYRNLFNLSPVPMWIYETDTLRFMDVNEAAIKHYGYSKEEFLSMTLKNIRRKEGARKLKKIREKLKGAKEHYRYVAKHVKKSGDVIDVDIRNSLLEINGKKVRLAIAADISERMKYIRAIEEQNQKLRDIAWVQSHIVRAPLARIMGLISLLKNYKMDPNCITDVVNFISKSAQELDNVIRDIVRKAEQVKDQPVLEDNSENWR